MWIYKDKFSVNLPYTQQSQKSYGVLHITHRITKQLAVLSSIALFQKVPQRRCSS